MAGTTYPNNIDGFSQLPLVVDNVSPVRAADVNRLRNAIVAVETEAGINPSGTYGTIRDRLDALEALLLEDGYFPAENVSVNDSDGYYSGTNVEDVLAEIGAELTTFLTSVSVDAGDVSVADSDGYYISTDVEGVLGELGSLTIDFISGHIETPEDKTYYLVINSPFSGTINKVTTQADSGTATATVNINGVAVGGSANAVSSSEVSESHSSGNEFVVGDDITLVISANSSADDLRFTIEFIRNL